MHYIAGTRFSVTNNSTRRESLLPGNNTYQLIHISKEIDGVNYIFTGLDRKKYEIKFKSCREADSYIARQRNEKIPNYDAVVIEDSDLPINSQ